MVDRPVVGDGVTDPGGHRGATEIVAERGGFSLSIPIV